MLLRDSHRTTLRQDLRRAAAELERRLRAGSGRVEDVLAEWPLVAEDAEAALELIYTEFVLRQELGQSPTAAEWYERFPQRRDDLRQLFEVHQFASPSLFDTRPGTDAPAVAPAADRLGAYEVLGEVGRGGMGVVYKARQVALNRVVALKMILPGSHADRDDLARLRAEAEAIARLQHPNIVQVHEVGEHDGLPFFSLEFCDGGSLEKRLASNPLPAKEAAALVATLARAMQAAHDRGVVHRDLKPANVLLARRASCQFATNDGQAGSLPYDPKVTDFGLARRLDQDSNQTRPGTVLGTPSYMAPEQAKGSKDVGPACDIYALGAILYECLTGRPPFRGATALDTLEQVRSLDPVPPRALQPTCPRDLETVCLKCLQKEPARRYATAQALADDLTRFLDGRPILARPVGPLERAGRWARRHPAAAGLIALTVVSLVGLAVGLLVVRGERDARGRALRHTEDALTALTDDALERAMGRQAKLSDEDQAFFRRVIALYERLADTYGDTAEGQARLADGLVRVGQMRQQLGDVAGAEESLDRALALHGSGEGRSRCLFALGYLYAETGRRPAAEAKYRAALDLSRPLGHRHPAQVADQLNALANLLRETNQLAEAEACYVEARELREALPADARDNRMKLAELASNLAGVHRATGRLDLAEQTLRDALALTRKVLADQPTLPRARQQLGIVCVNLGNLIYRKPNGTEEAVGLYRQAVEAFAALAAEFPTVPQYRERLAVAKVVFGAERRRAGRFPECQTLYRDAESLYRRLVEDFPNNPNHRRDLANLLNNLGNLLSDDLKQNRDAEAAYREAVRLREALVQEEPRVVFHRQTLATSYNNLGAFLDDTGRSDQAEGPYRQALQLQQALVAGNPKSPEYRDDLARTFGNLGNLLHKLDRLAEAEAAYRDGLRLRRQLVAEHPNSTDFTAMLAKYLGRLAGVLRDRRERAEAHVLMTEAEPLERKALEASPKNGEYRRARRDNRRLVADLHADAKDHANAARAAEVFLTALVTPDDRFDAVRLFARCAAAAPEAQAASYEARAVEQARLAVRGGFTRFAAFCDEADLVYLRQRPAFQAFLAALPADRP